MNKLAAAYAFQVKMLVAAISAYVLVIRACTVLPVNLAHHTVLYKSVKGTVNRCCADTVSLLGQVIDDVRGANMCIIFFQKAQNQLALLCGIFSSHYS